jgi:hypothetical protein
MNLFPLQAKQVRFRSNRYRDWFIQIRTIFPVEDTLWIYRVRNLCIYKSGELSESLAVRITLLCRLGITNNNL